MPSRKRPFVVSILLSVVFAVLMSCSTNKQEQASSMLDSLVTATDWGYNDDESKKEAAFKVLQNALINEKSLSQKSRYGIYNGIYFYHFFKGNFEKALSYADSMFYAIEATKNKKKYIKELAAAHYCKGDVLFKLGAYEQAYKNYFLAKKLQPIIVDKCANSNYSYRIAMILFRQSKYKEAIHHFKVCLDEVKVCKQSFTTIFKQQELLNNIALCYSRRNYIDSALVFYDKSMAFVNANDTLRGKKSYFMIARGVLYGNMGGEYLKQKQYKKAEFLLKKSIGINGRQGFDSVDVVTAKIKLINTYLQTNRPDSVHKYLKSLERSNRNLKVLENIQSYHLLYSKYLNAVGNSKGAFVHLQRYTTLTDSIQKQLDKLKSTNIDERFRNLSNENEIDTLKRDAEIQQRYLYMTMVFIVMSIFIVVLIYFYWRKSKRNIIVLTELNNEISLQKDRLQEALTQLGLSDKEKDTILRAVAHDLRNPIVGISSLTKLMILEDEEKLNTDKLVLIDGACNNALTLIDDIIEAAENKQDVNFEGKKTQAELIEIIKNAIALLSYRADEKMQRIQFEANINRLEIGIYAQKVSRVVSNLIGNAIKFSEQGKTIKVQLEKREKDVLVKVIDNGIGIPAKYGDDIFLLFTSSKRFGTKGEKSYGLGLSICKQIVTAHGGEIWYEENPTGGTVFCFTLPL
ncbi:MAG: HAMP domain-containing histidine kinase [Pedobacter sp.]|nr:MAG: HAMP domain-containing histidine kinase [Pedobacter sp.]